MIYDAFSTNLIVQTALRVMRAGVAAISVEVVIDLAENVFKSGNILNILLMFAAFIASWIFKVSAVTIVLIFIVLGLALSLKNKKEVKS